MGRLLAMDIETMGLMNMVPLPAVTCACLYDGETETRLLFWMNSAEEQAANAATLLRALDEAERIAGFNAVYFDLPYVQRWFGATEQQLSAWVAKCVDPFMCLKLIVRQTSKMQRLLELNDLGSKTGTGSNAIALATAGETEPLLDYCLMDAVLTYRLCVMDELRLTERVRGSIGKDGVWRLRFDTPCPGPCMGEALPRDDPAWWYRCLALVSDLDG